MAASNEGAKALEQAYQRQFAASQNVVKNYKAQTATEKARCAGRGCACRVYSASIIIGTTAAAVTRWFLWFLQAKAMCGQICVHSPPAEAPECQ